jgi:hypothetical protein
MSFHKVAITYRLLWIALAGIGLMSAQDPPTRVGRLSYVGGSVSFQPGGLDDWVAATLNRPLTAGDQLYSDVNGRAEVRVPGAAFRLGTGTALEFLNLDDQTVQLRLSEGALDVTVRRLDNGQIFEIDTSNLAFSISQPGEYRIDTDQNADQTAVTVRAGGGQITGNGAVFYVQPGQQAVVAGQDQPRYNVYTAPAPDSFDKFGELRDQREARLMSARYVSPYMVGYEDLDENGTWRSTPEYGQVWIPNRVAADWAPYHYGHWAWVDPWGWSWVDDASWGFAPFHYGRWAYYQGGWAWVPGPVAVAPVYAPALVAWVGFGGGSGVGISFGGDVGVGWFALGPRDVYIPAYRASEAYVTRVNVSNAVVINTTQVSNVYSVYVRTGNMGNVTYANRTVVGAVMAVPQRALTSARPVQQLAVKIQANQLNSIQAGGAAPRVAPQTASVLGRAPAGAQAPRPPAAVLSRPIVAKSAPPPRPAPFQQRQAVLAKDPGRPIPIQQQQQMSRAAATSAPRAAVKVLTSARQVTPQVATTPAPRPATADQRAPNAPAAAEPRAVQPQTAQPRQATPPPTQTPQPQKALEPPPTRTPAAVPPTPQREVQPPRPAERPQQTPPEQRPTPQARPTEPPVRPKATPPAAARPQTPPREEAQPAPRPAEPAARPQTQAPPPEEARPGEPPKSAPPNRPTNTKKEKEEKDTKKDQH